jgi:hypothetical protein
MPTPLRVSRALVRSLGTTLLLAVALLLSSGSLHAQVLVGIAMTKTCPVTAPPNTVIQCTFQITNQNTTASVINLSVTNQVPFPGGPITPDTCEQGGVPVTTLGPNGTATDTCNGSVDETTPPCGATNIFFIDRVAATGTDTGNQLPVSQSASGSVTILACTPTPSPTPTGTPPVNTPTPTNTPPQLVADVPTLSFPMMALLGLILAGAGLFLARRH